MNVIALPKPPDEPTLQLLTRISAFLHHAVSHSTRSSSLDRMAAIHGLDNVVEFLLRTIADHLEIAARTNKKLDNAELAGLAGDINGFLKDTYAFPLPYLTEIKRLRQMRNLVQHGLVDPAPELTRLVAIVTRFYSTCLSRIFGLDPTTIRPSSLVRSEAIKACLVQAEAAIDASRYLDAIIACRNAFENGLYERTDLSSLHWEYIPAQLELFDVDEQGAEFLGLMRHIIDELELVHLGVPIHSYNKYRSYTSFIPAEYRADSVGGRE